MRKRLIFLSIVPVILASCFNDDSKGGEAEKVDVYANYFVSGEEGKEFVTVFFQFSNGPEQMPSVLQEPAKVFLDEKLLAPDSAKKSGAYYEIQLPVAEFAGKHIIRFIDEDNREHRETFSFAPFQLLNGFTEVVKRNEMVLTLGGLPEKELMRVVMADTSFEGEGVNEIDTVVNGQLDLRKFLPAVKNGPVSLHLYKEEERPLNGVHKGKISITYGLKREFELKD